MSASPARLLFRRHRPALLATYSATAVENTFELLYPFAIGLAINDLIDDHRRGLIVFVAIWLAHTAVGLARQRFDTRVASRIYADAATELVVDQRHRDVPASTVVARAALVRNVVDVLEDDVTRAITALFACVGSLVMLAIYDTVIAGAAAALVVPVAVLNLRLARRSRRLHAAVNDELEHESALITSAQPEPVLRHYRLLARHRIALSDAEASTWGVLELAVIALAVLAFVRVTNGIDALDETGTVYATIAYLWSYVSSFDDIPPLTQSLANVRDIGTRMGPSPAGSAPR